MKEQRERMVYDIKNKYNFTSPEVLSIMLQIPRHQFLKKRYWNTAYSDNPVPLGFGQTMSQPFTVAFMTDLLELSQNEKVLEIGTGSGYQAAILSKLAKEVFSVEVVSALAEKASQTLKKLGYNNVFVKKGSGALGWREKSPFDAVVVTAGISGDIPRELFDQLKIDGIFLAPIGKDDDKKMIRFRKSKSLKYEDLKNISFLKAKGIWEEYGNFRFVPFVSEKQAS